MSSDAPSATEPGASRHGPIGWMANNPIAVNLLMLLLLLGGIWSALTMQKEVLPDFELDVVEVRVDYPGAAPAEVEQGILLPVEEAVRGVQGIAEVTSIAREGAGTVNIELVVGEDRMRAYQDIDQAVQRIRTFPEESEEPEVQLRVRRRRVVELGVYGPVDVWTLRRVAERLRDELLADATITQVELRRVPEYMTHVEIPLARLREYGLTLGQVASRIERSSDDIPAGTLETTAGEILLRVQERKQWADQLRQIVLATADTGAALRLGDIATIRDGFEEVGFHGQFNGQPSVEVQIFRVGRQSPLEIAEAAARVVRGFEPTLPEGVRVRLDSSSARDYEDRLSLLIENGVLAIVIVLGILALFLDFRLAFWVMMGMTTSFVGGLVFLPFVGVSVNMISMFGFLVVLGIVVDDAIVVGENVYERRLRGEGRLGAAVNGTWEMARPVVLSVLTTILAFVPLLVIPGTTGKYWKPLPAVVIVVLFASVFEALFLLPCHLAHTSRRRPSALEAWVRRHQESIAGALRRGVDRYYRPLLRASLRHRYITVCAALSLLIVVGGFGYSGHMGIILMPQVAADEIEAGVRLPVGTTRAQAARVAAEVTLATQRMFEEHDLYRAAVGIKTNVRRENFIDVEIVMKPPNERDMSAEDVIALWRDEIGDIAGVSQITFEAERGPGGAAQDLSIDLSHSDIDVLSKATRALVERLEALASTRDVSDNYAKGKARFDLRLRPAAAHLGLTSAEIGRQLRHAFFGALATRQLRGTNEVELRVKLPEAERQDMHTFDQFVIRTPSGGEVPLSEVAEVERSEAFARITRRDGRRVVSVGTDVEPKSAITRVLRELEEHELPLLRADFPGLTWSFEGAQAEMRESTRALWGGFALAMAVIYSLLAVTFKSYLQPLIVMGAIPFGIVGAVIGHILLDTDLSLVSLMGVIALSGVVVNDALIMVDYANGRRRGGASAFEAIFEAGQRRFRPILLTTLTTFGGLAPIIVETSNQARHLIPMAISLGFGILFATAIILLLVPSVYLLLEDWTQGRRVPAADSSRREAPASRPQSERRRSRDPGAVARVSR